MSEKRGNPKPNPKKFWVKHFFGVCPICKKNTSFDKRIYSVKPDSRHHHRHYMTEAEAYCGCMGSDYVEAMAQLEEQN